MCCGPYGPQFSTRVGPYRPMQGVPTAAARCRGPVSEPITRRARRMSAANCGRLVAGACNGVTARFGR